MPWKKAWCLLVNLGKEDFSKNVRHLFVCGSFTASESKMDREEVQFGIGEDTHGK